MLRRIVLAALVAGSVAGTAAAALQQLKAVPLIRQAEVYETAAALEHRQHAGHLGGAALAAGAVVEEVWEPTPGLERVVLTILADVIAGVGFGLMLTGGFALYGVAGGQVDARSGILWGLGGLAVFSLAPALGLPPELPGAASAALADRQIWWVATAFATAAGLSLTIFGKRLWMRGLGIVLLILPHLIGAPHPAEEASSVPAALAAEFVVASIATAAAFWLILGGVGGWLYRRLDGPFPRRGS